MRYFEYLDQLYNELCRESDFPMKKAEKLWETLPFGSRDLAAIIYLLPFGEQMEEPQRRNAKVLTLLTLSAFIHGDLEKNRAFNDGEAVLYGDYLFALAFSLLPDDIQKEQAESILERAYHFSENRLSHRCFPADEKESLIYAAEDYGKHLKSIAEEAEEEYKEQYALCAETIGTLWGILCENYPADIDGLRETAKKQAKGLPMEPYLLEIIDQLGRSIG